MQTCEHNAYGHEEWAAPHSQHRSVLPVRDAAQGRLVSTFQHTEAYKHNRMGGEETK